ncbi:MAG: [acyl-carrier-protein] S-malonyltransferase [Rhodothermales bacterium]|jgi:[acyl-carrier-protein] S-malonyltransferase
MSKTSFLFPGQGSQYVGMGQDLLEESPIARDLFQRADDTLGFSLSKVMFGSGDTEADVAALQKTENTQPALYCHSMAVMAILDAAGFGFEMTAGHSLGEYSALAAAGVLAFEDGLTLVRERGRLMSEAGERQPGTMAAIIGMDDKDVEAVCSDVEVGVVQPANFNSPGQVVISGDLDGVAKAMTLALDRGARRAIQLPVSGAFHSPLMAHAREGLAEALASVSLAAPRCPVYLNVTAAPETDPEQIRQRLLDQLLSPVRWSQTLLAMHEHGAGIFVEVGAGRVLSGLVKRTLGREVKTAAIGTIQDISSYTALDA